MSNNDAFNTVASLFRAEGERPSGDRVVGPITASAVERHVRRLQSGLKDRELKAKHEALIAEAGGTDAARAGWDAVKAIKPGLDGVASFDDLPIAKAVEYAVFGAGARSFSPEPAVEAVQPVVLRTFNKGDVIPDDVQKVNTGDGDTLTRRANGLFSYTLLEGFLPADTAAEGRSGERWYDTDFPLTEVTEELVAPRVFLDVADVPEGVVFGKAKTVTGMVGDAAVEPATRSNDLGRWTHDGKGGYVFAYGDEAELTTESHYADSENVNRHAPFIELLGQSAPEPVAAEPEVASVVEPEPVRFERGDKVRVLDNPTSHGGSTATWATAGQVVKVLDGAPDSDGDLYVNDDGSHCWIAAKSVELVADEPYVFKAGDRAKITGPLRMRNGGNVYLSPSTQTVVVERASAFDGNAEVRGSADFGLGLEPDRVQFIDPASLTLVEDEPAEVEDKPAEPRVFQSGTDVPEGVTVKEFGTGIKYTRRGDQFDCEVCGNLTHGVEFFDAERLTEVLAEPAKVPRVFNEGDVIPDDVQQVTASDGSGVLTRRENGEFSYGMPTGYLPAHTGGRGHDGVQWYAARFPLTEVLGGDK